MVVLTVGESTDVVREGGIIQLSHSPTRVRFSVNAAEATRRGAVGVE